MKISTTPIGQEPVELEDQCGVIVEWKEEPFVCSRERGHKGAHVDHTKGRVWSRGWKGDAE